MLRILSILGLALSSTLVAAVEKKGLRATHAAASFVRSLEFKHRLRVCNAYPYGAALDLYRGNHEKLTENAPLAYQACQDFKDALRPGDKLEFKVGDASAGTFAVSDLPQNDATLLLVIYRHDTLSTAVSFESHVFANLMNAQLAVLDAYRGSATSKMMIQDTKDSKTSRSEELRYDSVVAVNPGKYSCILQSADGKEVARKKLVALNKESYVAIRTGVDAQQGPSYPQSLMVYPASDESALGAAVTTRVSLMVLAMIAFMPFLQ